MVNSGVCSIAPVLSDFLCFITFHRILCHLTPHFAPFCVLQRPPEASRPLPGRVKKSGWAQRRTPSGPRANTGIHSICSQNGLALLVLFYNFLFTCATQRHVVHFYTLLLLLLTTLAVFERLLVPKWAHLGPRMWSKCCVYQCLLVFAIFRKKRLQTRSFAPHRGTMGTPRPPQGPPSVHFEAKK